MKCYTIDVPRWGNCPRTITAHETASKARYAAFLALRDIVAGIKITEIVVRRAPWFDYAAEKLKDRFIEPRKAERLFDHIRQDQMIAEFENQ